jgi:hypothetical protein
MFKKVLKDTLCQFFTPHVIALADSAPKIFVFPVEHIIGRAATGAAVKIDGRQLWSDSC